ncbi:hypothetical protein IHE45_17G117100 [Dioscorea alata]|uniref:Uncharacterized protein n=1 Tax=Dioscorea alata TaxID=55571 RepID=A0ACB7UES7_DIOAL|nr:hypothetical protein IHE45_17G117100 [Dioscorea alata]
MAKDSMEKLTIGNLVAFILVFLIFFTSMSNSFPGSPRKLLCIADHGEGCGEPNHVLKAHSRRFVRGIIFGPPSPTRNQNTGQARAPPPGII